MKFIHRRKIFLSIVILGLLLICFIPVRQAIVFYNGNSNQLVAYLPIESGDFFQIIYTHSIHLTDVVEKFRITSNGDIDAEEITYEEFGIGMPSNAEEGETFVQEDGKYRITNLNRTFTSINIRNGKTVSKQRLVWGEDEEHLVWFNDYFPQASWYTVKVEKLSLWQSFKGVIIHD
ncbi:DUF1850 domain-containing protein [Paucisalibacillus globulus]|uniref:DUF1850 domain-containing protein n=1 Tax=Paucisalibacillus globulus TaxID=351095 RepID=UPI0003FDEF9F|nr:DUF1850 domain-containing protein [Paucisalibacillus globulus]